MHAWLFPRIDRPIRTLHWFTFIAQNNETVRNITIEILAMKDQGIAVFWNFVVTFAFHNSHIISVLLDSANLILEELRNKCSVFKILKEQLILWRVENELWGQKHGYDTGDLKSNLRLEVFDRESKPSGFVWLSWIHISFFQQLLAESISSVERQIVSISGESSKLKVRRTLVTNQQTIVKYLCRDIYESHIKKRTPSTLWPLPSSLNSASLLAYVS